MRYLKPAELIAINAIVILESGGSSGLRDEGLLKSLTIKPQTRFAGEDIYPGVPLKAAVLFEAIVNYHVFVDGNKRTAVAALVQFLRFNKWSLAASHNEIETFALAVATKDIELVQASMWIRSHLKGL